GADRNGEETIAESFTIPATEIEAYATKEAFAMATDNAGLMAHLAYSLNGKTHVPAHGGPIDRDLPTGLMTRSISPDGSKMVLAESVDDETTLFFLYDVNRYEKVGFLAEGGSASANHMSHSTRWSDDGDMLAFLSDARWTTMDAPIFSVKEGSVLKVADVAALAQDTAWQFLKKESHPYAADGDGGMHGFVKILSFDADGHMHLILETESKSDEPNANVRTEMTLKIREPLSGGIRVLGSDDLPRGAVTLPSGE
ncbi:MAG: hypothetical protein AAF226_13120, partial [Verrucomicrobiota bacterium]